MCFYEKNNAPVKLRIIDNPYQNVVVGYTIVQKKTVSAYSTSKQIQPFDFAEHYSSSELTMRICCRWMPSLLAR